MSFLIKRLFTMLLLTMLLAACAAPAAQVPTPIPPTEVPTTVPPTATPVPPTATPVPPTATPVPPTPTPLPPTPTPLPERPDVVGRWVYLEDENCDQRFTSAHDVLFRADGQAESQNYFGVTGAWQERNDSLTVQLFRDNQPVTFTREGRLFSAKVGEDCLELRPAFDGPTVGEGRSFHQSFTLTSGEIVMLGGMQATATQDRYRAAASVQHYDPQTAIWATLGDLDGPRLGAIYALLDDDRILVIGGSIVDEDNDRAVEADVRVVMVDATTTTLTPASDLGYPVSWAAAATLADGQVLLTGGHWWADGQTTAYSQTLIYNPATDRWREAASMPGYRSNHRANRLPDGRVLITGGLAWNGESFDEIASSLIYDPAADRWDETPDMAARRHYHSAVTLSDGRVMVVGGFGPDVEAGTNQRAELFDPERGTWSDLGLPPGNHTGVVPAIVLPDGSVLLAGGGYYFEGVSSDVSRYDPATATWSSLSPLRLTRAMHQLNLLPDGRVLVTGGIGPFRGTPALHEIYDPADGGSSELVP
ncbi:MAG: Kelch repeat-containing protein [Oscillochloridaceae bacterium umkhey_bin13]